MFKFFRAIIVGAAFFFLTPIGAMIIAWVLTGFNNDRSAMGNVGYCFSCLFDD